MEPIVVILVLAVALTILYQYRHIFSFLRFRLTFKSVEKRVEESSKPGMGRVCPWCGDSMEEGYLFSQSGIYWSNEVPHLPPTSRFPVSEFEGEPLASSYLSYLGTVPNLRACRCMRCGIIRVDMRLKGLE